MAVRQNTKQIFVTISVPAKTVISLLLQPITVQCPRHETRSGPMGGEDRWLMIISDGSFISIFSLWAGLIRVYVIWSLCGRESADTSQDICQYQELSPCYPQPVLTTTLPINLPTNHFQPPDFVPIYMYAPCNTFTQFSKNKSFEFRTKIMSINSWTVLSISYSAERENHITLHCRENGGVSHWHFKFWLSPPQWFVVTFK